MMVLPLGVVRPYPLNHSSLIVQASVLMNGNWQESK
jgi:hypothetical protein